MQWPPTPSNFFPILSEVVLVLNTCVDWLFKLQWFILYIKKGSSFLYLFFNSINLLLEVELVLLCMTRSTIWFVMFSTSLNLPATLNKVYLFQMRLLLQNVSWQPVLFLTHSLATLASNSIDQKVSWTLFLWKEETPKTFLLHRVFSFDNGDSF